MISLQHLPWRTQLVIYTICIFFTSASYTMCVPFLPVYLLELGAPEENIEFWSAVVFSSCFLIAGVMAPIWGKISDIKGKKSMALRSSILLCICYTSGGLVTAPIQLLGMRVLQGFANGYLPVVLSIVSEQSPQNKLGTSLSYVQSSQLIGTVSGPLLGGTLAQFFGYRASFLIAGACLALVVIITFLLPNNKPKHLATSVKSTTGASTAAASTTGASTAADSTAGADAITADARTAAEGSTAAEASATAEASTVNMVRSNADNAPDKTTIWQDLAYCFTHRIVCELLLLFGCFSMVMLSIQPLLSLFVAELIGGYADVAFYAGLACSLPPLIGAVSAPLWGLMGQRKGYYRVIAISLLGTGVFIALQSTAHSFTSLMILSGLMGIFIVGFTPALNAAVTIVTPANFKGRAFGAMTMTSQFGCMLGPVMAAVVSHLFAIRYQFLVSGTILLIMFTYVTYRYYQIRKSKIAAASTALLTQGSSNN